MSLFRKTSKFIYLLNLHDAKCLASAPTSPSMRHQCNQPRPDKVAPSPTRRFNALQTLFSQKISPPEPTLTPVVSAKYPNRPRAVAAPVREFQHARPTFLPPAWSVCPTGAGPPARSSTCRRPGRQSDGGGATIQARTDGSAVGDAGRGRGRRGPDSAWKRRRVIPRGRSRQGMDGRAGGRGVGRGRGGWREGATWAREAGRL